MPYTSVIDVLLILTKDDRVLLARRENTGYADGQWNLPSGKLEAGEDVVAAIIREADEEIGLSLNRDDLHMAAAIHYRAPEGHARVGFVFHAQQWTGEPYNREPDKCSALEWFPLDELPDQTVPYTAAGVNMFRQGQQFGIHGWPDHDRP